MSLEELKYGLKQAIAKGLQLAIFNSCDGLGLAQALEPLHLPKLIVMREPVPDRVAQEFLKHLLAAFSGGKSLYLSVREARERLQGLEDHFPCATWLPVICQNSTNILPTWHELVSSVKNKNLRLDEYLDADVDANQIPLDTVTQAANPRDRRNRWNWLDPVRKKWFVVLISLVK